MSQTCSVEIGFRQGHLAIELCFAESVAPGILNLNGVVTAAGDESEG